MSWGRGAGASDDVRGLGLDRVYVHEAYEAFGPSRQARGNEINC